MGYVSTRTKELRKLKSGQFRPEIHFPWTPTWLNCWPFCPCSEYCGFCSHLVQVQRHLELSPMLQLSQLELLAQFLDFDG